jgi:hypothetical protein
VNPLIGLCDQLLQPLGLAVKAIGKQVGEFPGIGHDVVEI